MDRDLIAEGAVPAMEDMGTSCCDEPLVNFLQHTFSGALSIYMTCCARERHLGFHMKARCSDHDECVDTSRERQSAAVMNARGHQVHPGAQTMMPRILLVEDDTIQRYILAEWLHEAGYEVVEVASADEAVALLSSLLPIRLVITDVDMPGGLDGYDLADHSHRESPAVPVIVTSGRAPQRQAGSLQSYHFLRKPYDPAAMTMLVATLLSSQGEPMNHERATKIV